MASDTQIANLALLHMGVSKRIANLTTEQSIEAETLRTAYADDRDYCLRDFPWPWATAYVELGLVSSPTVAYNADWFYAYRYPSGCLFVRRIVTPLGRTETEPAPFRIGRDAQGRLIFTNYPDASVEYTAAITDPQEFDAIFIQMLAWKLTASCGPSLSRDPQISVRAAQMYEIEKTKAQSRARNEAQETAPLEAEWIREREGPGSGRGETETIYPSGYSVL
jgi:hypothetical protein